MKYFASGFEACFIEYPILEPIYLYGGAEPVPELTNRLVLAEPVPISQRLAMGTWEFGNTTFKIIIVPGHGTVLGPLEYQSEVEFNISYLKKNLLIRNRLFSRNLI